MRQEQSSGISRKMRCCVIVFFAALFLIGALTSGSYGIPWDEKTEQAILNANMREYLHCFDLEHLIPPYTEAESEYRISTSIEKDHGIAVYYPIGMYILQRDTLPTKQLSYVWQSYTYLVNFLGVLAVYGLVAALFQNRILGMAAAAMYFFTPRMFAQMHYNNKDMVCLTLVLLTLYFGVRWIQTNKPHFAVSFAAAGAFAANARLIAAFAFGLVGCCYLLLYVRACYGENALPEQERKHRFREGILAIIACGICYVLITPAMWLRPVEYVRYLISNTFHFSRWNGKVLFDGMIYTTEETSVPRSYLPTMVGITTPVYLLVLILFGTVVVWARALKTKLRDTDALLPAMVSVMWLFPMLLAVGLNTHIYNGWRQFYFIYGPMIVCAAAGIDCLYRWFRQRGVKLVRIGGAVLTGCILASAVGIARNHPYQMGYVNVLAGENAERRYELDYWHLSSGPLIRNLLDSLPEDAVIGIGRTNPWDDHALNAAYKQLMPEQQERVEKVRGVAGADYVILNLSALKEISDEIDPLTPIEEYPQLQLSEPTAAYEELCYLLAHYCEHSRVTSYGNTLMVLYEKNDGSN